MILFCSNPTCSATLTVPDELQSDAQALFDTIGDAGWRVDPSVQMIVCSRCTRDLAYA